jgi:ABC-type polysaccharide transport system permease subunit
MMDMSILLALSAVPHLFSWVRLKNRVSNAIQEDSTTFNQMLTEGLERENNSDKK